LEVQSKATTEPATALNEGCVNGTRQYIVGESGEVIPRDQVSAKVSRYWDYETIAYQQHSLEKLGHDIGLQQESFWKKPADKLKQEERQVELE
jgi:hypothetical protein